MINIIVLLKEGVVVTSQRLVLRDKTRGCCYEPKARTTGQDVGVVVTSQRLVLRDKTRGVLLRARGSYYGTRRGGCCYEPEARITGQDAGVVVTSQRLVLRDKTGAALDGWGWNGS